MGWSGMSEGLGEGGGQVIMWGEQSSPFGWNTYLGLTDMGGSWPPPLPGPLSTGY